MNSSFHPQQISSIEDCVEFQYLLIGDVRDLLEEWPDEINRRWLVAVLDVLLSLMPRECELLDEQGGYLADVLHEFPSWERQVLQLRNRKSHLQNCLRQLRDQIHSNRPWVAIADQARCELRDWMDMLLQLRDAEVEMMQNAYLLDIGIGD